MKALVLFSGGLDSSVCLALAVQKYGASNVMALSVSYGQKHSKEIQAAKAIAEHYQIALKQLDFSSIFEGSNCSLLVTNSNEIPHEDYAEQLQKTDGQPVSTYVPFRNGLFLTAAASIALCHGAEVIYYGAHADDAAGNAYPDTSTAFNDAIASSIWIGSGNAVKLEAPFINSSKASVVAMGLKLGVPFEKTWSCYEGTDKPCGTCGTCRDRIKAFELNGISDPLIYH